MLPLYRLVVEEATQADASPKLLDCCALKATNQTPGGWLKRREPFAEPLDLFQNGKNATGDASSASFPHDEDAAFAKARADIGSSGRTWADHKAEQMRVEGDGRLWRCHCTRISTQRKGKHGSARNRELH